MARLAIRKVIYSGKNYRYQSPYLDDGLNILEGYNGSGKTTFSEMINFGLGGKARLFEADWREKHKEITSDEDNYVILQVEIDEKRYLAKRFIGSNDIAIQAEGEDEASVYPIYRRDDKAIFSDWILEKINIEPVELYFGTKSFTINFMDLFRLIYHDQMADPSRIYKEPIAVNNYVQDSKVIRKAIFEILVGKSFQEYYSSFGRYKDLERQKNEISGALESFILAISEIQNDREDMNIIFLEQKLAAEKDRLKKMLDFRKTLLTRKKTPATSNDSVDQIKTQLLQMELKSTDLMDKQRELYDEMIKLNRVKEDTVLEATQIRKMMFAHDELRLFSADTCPYCLTEVVRQKDKCVCGADVKEDQYEKFFYTSDEYLTILKTKQKNVSTIDVAIEACRDDLASIKESLAELETGSQKLKEEIKLIVSNYDFAYDVSELNQLDDQIMDAKSEINALEYQMSLEKKREELQTKNDKIGKSYDSARKEVERLYNTAQSEMEEQRELFSDKYKELLKKTITACRTAGINDDYMPVINDEEHLEASAKVPKRLMYYLTLLYLALNNENVRFPRFLLIDTPDTLGIDDDNLVNSISQIKSIIPDEFQDKGYQIILTTGLKKYPDEFSEKVFGSLDKREGKMLLVASGDSEPQVIEG